MTKSNTRVKSNSKSKSVVKSGYDYNPNKQLRNWDILTYCSKEFIQSVLDSHSEVIRAYAFIYHDKFSQWEIEQKAKEQNIDVSKVRIVPHFHIVIRLTRPFKLITIKNWFICFDENGKKITTRCGDKDFHEAFDYLTHANDPLKYQFPKSERICNNIQAFRTTHNSDDQISIDIVDDMLNEVPIYDILQKYGNNFAYHINQYKMLFDLIYYGKEFVEIRNKNKLLNFNRSFNEVNKTYLSVDNLDDI